MVKNDVKILEIAKKLRGLQTVSTISKNLNVTRKTAVNYAWNLRKAGYLTSTGGGRNIKFYRISPLKFKKRDGYSLYELINKYSRIKLNISQDYIIHLKKEPSPEEILVRAVSSKEFRLMLASLELFNKINNWSKLKKLAEKLRIRDKIEWRGFVSYDKVPEALSEIDIFVYPSWHEGFGRSIMEALAMEKPVVATNVGGIPDLINNGENGFLVEPHNSEMLAQKIKELMENKELREKFGKAGREFVSKNYEWNDGIKKFAQLFLELK